MLKIKILIALLTMVGCGAFAGITEDVAALDLQSTNLTAEVDALILANVENTAPVLVELNKLELPLQLKWRVRLEEAINNKDPQKMFVCTSMTYRAAPPNFEQARRLMEAFKASGGSHQANLILMNTPPGMSTSLEQLQEFISWWDRSASDTKDTIYFYETMLSRIPVSVQTAPMIVYLKEQIRVLK